MELQYHIVFAPGKILRELCKWKGVNIIEAEVCPDHVHMLVEIPPKMAVSWFMGFLKGKSSLMIYEKWGNLKYKYRGREFWCRGYYVDTVGKNTKAIAEWQTEERLLGVASRIAFKAVNDKPPATPVVLIISLRCLIESLSVVKLG